MVCVIVLVTASFFRVDSKLLSTKCNHSTGMQNGLQRAKLLKNTQQKFLVANVGSKYSLGNKKEAEISTLNRQFQPPLPLSDSFRLLLPSYKRIKK